MTYVFGASDTAATTKARQATQHRPIAAGRERDFAHHTAPMPLPQQSVPQNADQNPAIRRDPRRQPRRKSQPAKMRPKSAICRCVAKPTPPSPRSPPAARRRRLPAPQVSRSAAGKPQTARTTKSPISRLQAFGGSSVSPAITGSWAETCDATTERCEDAKRMPPRDCKLATLLL